eukprot:40760-Hanusia_phi.AAC.1
MTGATVRGSVVLLASQVPQLRFSERLRSRRKPKAIQVVFDKSDPERVKQQQPGVFREANKEEEAELGVKVKVVRPILLLLTPFLARSSVGSCSRAPSPSGTSSTVDTRGRLPRPRPSHPPPGNDSICLPDGWLLPAAPSKPVTANMHNFSTWLPTVYRIACSDADVDGDAYKSTRAFDAMRNLQEYALNMLSSEQEELRLKGIDFLQAILCWIPEEDISEDEAEIVLPTYVHFLNAVYRLDEARGKLLLVAVLFGDEMVREKEPTALLNLRGEAIYLLKKEIQSILKNGVRPVRMLTRLVSCLVLV